MLSRTANALTWMARYMERAEASARLAEVNLTLSLDLQGQSQEAWDAVVATTGDLEAFNKHYGAATRDNALQFLVLDVDNPNSVANALSQARENARTVREHLPSEAWELLNSLYLLLKPAASGEPGQREGLLDATLLRDEGWHFVQIGRFLERADQTSRLVDVQHALLEGRTEDPARELRWESVLKSATGLTMYRRKHGATEGRRVAQFLLLSQTFPRSVAFCLASADAALRGLQGTPPGQFRNPAEKALGRLTFRLSYTELDDVLGQGVHAWLDHLQLELLDVGAALDATYFDPGASAPGQDSYEQPEQQQQQRLQ